MKRLLIIQTAFIGDVILATPVIRALRNTHPEASITMLVRKGNEGILANHPELDEVLIWDKTNAKHKHLWQLIWKVRRKKYHAVYNLHRFATSGIITLFSGASKKVGFTKNPFSFAYTKKVVHQIGDGTHEIQRNLSLLHNEPKLVRPEVFPAEQDELAIQPYTATRFVCIAPASVWFTKQFHQQGWVDLCNALPQSQTIYLLGSPGDGVFCEEIKLASSHTKIEVLAGKLSLLQSAALMARAQMNYVNDSAPLHLASALNAPVRAVFCSTVPKFGFGPVSNNAKVVEVAEDLYCRPCGLHGYKKCPEGHFKCAKNIKTEQFFK